MAIQGEIVAEVVQELIFTSDSSRLVGISHFSRVDAATGSGHRERRPLVVAEGEDDSHRVEGKGVLVRVR